MLSNRPLLILTTALAPLLWGTTYLTTTAFLPPGHPLLTATIRAVPAGLILLAVSRRLPTGSWWWRSFALGSLNIGIFFACLFVAAQRLPGGVAAVVGGIQPLIVAVLAWRLLGERLTALAVLAGIGGVIGVGLVVVPGDTDLDPIGVAAALGGALSMAVGTVLTKRWGGGQPPLAMTAWQLVGGGVLLAALTLAFEPLPDRAPTALGLSGYAYLSILGTAVAYALWFRGIRALPTRVPAFLGLVSPVVAVLLGLVVAGETLSGAQAVGLLLVLVCVAAVVSRGGASGSRSIAAAAYPRSDSNRH